MKIHNQPLKDKFEDFGKSWKEETDELKGKLHDKALLVSSAFHYAFLDQINFYH